MSNNPPPNTIYLQWDGDAEPSEPCSADPDDRDVTWCRERVFARDIQFERSARIKEFERELEQERALADRLAESLDRTLQLMGKWLEAERELADRLAESLDRTLQLVAESGDSPPEAEIDLAAWKEARRGTI